MSTHHPSPFSFPLDSEAIVQELATTIQSGIRSAATTLLNNYSASTKTIPRHSLQSLLKNLFTALQPAIQQELLTQLQLVRTSLLMLPKNADENLLSQKLAEVRVTTDRKSELEVDAELAGLRAEIRSLDVELRYLEAVKAQVKDRKILLQRLGNVNGGDLKNCVVGIEEAENELKGCVRVLRMDGMDNDVGVRKETREDEHAPMSCFEPMGMGVLDLDTDQQQLKALNELKERLLA